MSVNFAGSDAPLSPTQQSTINTGANQNGHQFGQVNTIPESAGGIVMAYNIPTGITGHLNLTSTLIAEIMQRNITTWGDPALKANNLNPGLTATSAITVIHRSDGSGTTYAFSNYLNVSAPGTWVLGQNTLLNWDPATVGAKGNPGVASAISSTNYALGYVELAYALQHQIATAYVQNKDGNFVNATLAGITTAVNTATNNLPSSTGDWSHVSINYQAGASTYPICTFTYLFVYSNITAYGNVGAGLIAFLKYIMTPEAQNDSVSIGYVPLPQSLLTKNLATINSITYSGNATDYAASSSVTSSSSGPSTSPGFEFISMVCIFAVASVVMINKRKNKMN